MLKLLYVGLFVAIAVLVASSSDPTPTPTAPPAPTATPVPTNTPEPTATPVPATATPVPEPTAMPEAEDEDEDSQQETGMVSEEGGLAPLNMTDPEAIAAELSESELACIAGAAGTDRVLELFANPDLATPEEQTALIECLEDETLLRIFLTGLIGDTGPLSVETSMCIRGGTEEIDLRAVMLAGNAGDEQMAMVGSMSAFFLTLACLSDEEFEAAGPALGMTAQDRASMDCVLEQLGGPEGMAETLAAGDETAFMTLFGVAMGCGLELDGPPSG